MAPPTIRNQLTMLLLSLSAILLAFYYDEIRNVVTVTISNSNSNSNLNLNLIPSIPSIESILNRFRNCQVGAEKESIVVVVHDGQVAHADVDVDVDAEQQQQQQQQLDLKDDLDLSLDLQSLKNRYIKANQSQLFSEWDQLSTNQRIKLLTQLQKLAPNPESFLVEVEKAIELSSSMSTTSHDDDGDKQHLKPLPESNYVVQKNVSVDQRNSWQDEGYKLISEGKVGLVLKESSS
ncbi:unnamed protein product [Ambrosiozyma monospora]|uniref:Unnamed protein product n=1 Tax=Ambrosiozyma monospora TaxID=43982 RepID=A0A9W6Z5R4_AMBMO|nr:unnamed protein product [Ambrosiozyma monospora]